MHDLTLSPDARAACADRTAAHIEALAALVSSESRRIRIRPGVGVERLRVSVGGRPATEVEVVA